MVTRREAWRESQDELDPDRLVFIDETWASTKHGANTWPLPARRTPACQRSSRPLENNNLRRRSNHPWHHRSLGT